MACPFAYPWLIGYRLSIEREGEMIEKYMAIVEMARGMEMLLVSFEIDIKDYNKAVKEVEAQLEAEGSLHHNYTLIEVMKGD